MNADSNLKYFPKLKNKHFKYSSCCFIAGKMVESKKALPKEPRLGGLDCSPPHSRALDSSPPHSRALDNSLHLYTSLHGFHRHGISSAALLVVCFAVLSMLAGSAADLHSYCSNPDPVLLLAKDP